MIMNKPVKSFFSIVGIVALGFVLWYLRELIVFFVIAAVISIIGAPLVRKIKSIKLGKIKFGGAFAAAITLLLFISFFTGLVLLLSPLISEQANLISNLDTEQITQSLQGKFLILQDWLTSHHLTEVENSNQEFLIEKFKSIFNFNWISSLFDNIIGVMGNAFVAVFSILFIAFFLLKDGNMLASIIYALTPDKHLPKIKKILTNNDKMLTSYLIGVLIQIFITSTVVSVGLLIIGVDNALIIGILSGFMNVIPYIGPLFGLAIGIFVAVTTNLGLDADISILSLSLRVLLVFGIAQLVDNFFTQPVILSKSVNAHPLEIFLVISASATLAGIGGMIVAIPLYTAIKIIASEFLIEYKFIQSLTKEKQTS